MDKPHTVYVTYIVTTPKNTVRRSRTPSSRSRFFCRRNETHHARG
jgi:hypothetical protein